jgi:hypothetical protein
LKGEDVYHRKDEAGQDDCSSRVEGFSQRPLDDPSVQKFFTRTDQQKREWDQYQEDSWGFLADLNDLIGGLLESEICDYR